MRQLSQLHTSARSAAKSALEVLVKAAARADVTDSDGKGAVRYVISGGNVRSCRPHQWPPRIAAGAYILDSGLTLAQADREAATGVYGMAADGLPVPPPLRSRDGSSGCCRRPQIAVGSALLLPVVPSLFAGAALTAFAGGLLTFYVKTPGLREDGTLRPSQEGVSVAKDVWLLGIGLGLVLEELTQR